MKKLVFILLACLLLPTLIQAAPQTLTLQGLSELVAANKGRVVVVNFFATWCPPCREELPHLTALSKHFGDRVVVMGLSVDEDHDVVEPFVESMGVTYAVRLADSKLLRRFGISSIPHNVIYGVDGVMKANQSGYVDKESLQAFIDGLLEQK